MSDKMYYIIEYFNFDKLKMCRVRAEKLDLISTMQKIMDGGWTITTVNGYES